MRPIRSNFGPILHRFWDTATYWLKIAYFPTPCDSEPSLFIMFPVEFHSEVNRDETFTTE